MYKPIDKLQHSFLDFNQPMGLHMNPDNRWVRLADRIPWDEFEVKYAKLFPSDTGNVAKPLRMALGALIIQTKFQFSDRELVEQIAENPYLQYFIGLPGFREEAPFDVLWSSIFVTLMANKIGGLQFGIYRNCQISSRVFHTAVAALPLTKANRSDFE